MFFWYDDLTNLRILLWPIHLFFSAALFSAAPAVPLHLDPDFLAVRAICGKKVQLGSSGRARVPCPCNFFPQVQWPPLQPSSHLHTNIHTNYTGWSHRIQPEVTIVLPVVGSHKLNLYCDGQANQIVRDKLEGDPGIWSKLRENLYTTLSIKCKISFEGLALCRTEEENKSYKSPRLLELKNQQNYCHLWVKLSVLISPNSNCSPRWCCIKMMLVYVVPAAAVWGVGDMAQKLLHAEEGEPCR